jgi:hypothetical protein
MRFILPAALVFVIACEKKRDPPALTDQEFHNLMKDTKEFYDPVLRVYAKSEGNDVVHLRLNQWAAGTLDPKKPETHEEVWKGFERFAAELVRYPRKEENEIQLYRRVIIEAEPNVPGSVLDRIEKILRAAGARNITRRGG